MHRVGRKSDAEYGRDGHKYLTPDKVAALIKAAKGKLLLEEGYIALQAESHPCEFRNIELRVLKNPAKVKRDAESRISIVPPRKRS